MPRLFVPDPRFLAELKTQEEHRQGLLEIAEGVVPIVESLAPRGDTGEYADSIEAFDDGQRVGITSTDFAAHLVEYGSANNPPYAPLRRGATAAGLRLKEDPK